MPETVGRRRRSRLSLRLDEGFTLVELMIAMTIFALMLVGFGLLLGGSLRAYRFARARTVAETLGSGEIDKARQVGWANLGTVSGNPPGTLVPDEDVTVGNNAFHVSRRVELVDDNVPTYGYGTGGNYKRVVVTLSSAAMTKPVVYETLVAPPTQPSLYNAAVQVTTLDTCGNALPGATATIANGPSPTRNDTSDATGLVKFSALTPTNTSAPGDFYDVTGSMAGWQMLPSASPGDTHFALNPGEVATPSVQLYKPATLKIHLVDLLDQPVTSSYALDITDWNGTAAPTLSGQSADGTVTLSTFGSGTFVPCKSYTFKGTSLGFSTASPAPTALTIANYPTATVYEFNLRIPIPARTTTTFHFVDNTTGLPVPGVTGTVDDTSNSQEPDRAFTADAAGATTLALLPDNFTITGSAPAGYFAGNFTYTVAVPTAGQQPAPVDATLRLVPYSYSTVAFTTRDPVTTLPIGGVPVTLTGGPGGPVTLVSDPLTGQVTASVVQATYTVTVSAPPLGYQAYSATLTVGPSTTAANVNLVTVPSVTLATKNAGTGAAVPNVTVLVSGGPSANATLVTDATGAVTTSLLPGVYTVKVTAPPSGYSAFTGTMTVVAGSSTYTVSLGTGSTVTFTPKDGSTNAAVGSITLGYAGGPSGTGTVAVGGSGSASKVLLPGTYTITFAGNSNYQAYSGTLTVGSGSTTQVVTLWSTNPVSLSLKGTNSTGGNLSSSAGKVTLTGPSGTTATLSLPKNGGNSSSVNLLPGVYTVNLVQLPTGSVSLLTTTVTITGGGNYTIAFAP